MRKVKRNFLKSVEFIVIVSLNLCLKKSIKSSTPCKVEFAPFKAPSLLLRRFTPRNPMGAEGVGGGYFYIAKMC